MEPKFIYDSVEQKSLLKIESYKTFPNTGNENENVQHLVSFLDNRDGANTTTNTTEQDSTTGNTSLQLATTNQEVQPAISRSIVNKNGFTPQEDAMIIDEVRRNPNRRSTHKLFDEIALKIGRHTGNSIRYRFRTHLQASLDWVYLTDEAGNLILDQDGRPKVAEGLPSTVKRKFDAKDDYDLAVAVRENLLEKHGDRYERDSKDVVLPGKFFETLAQNFPHHTKSAWRDRYRKFVIPYGIDKYIEYYQEEETNGRIPEEIKNFTGKNLYKSSKRYRTGSIDDQVGETLTEHNDQYDQQRRRANAKKRKQQQQDANNLFAAADNDEISGLGHSGNFFDNHAAAAVAAANRINSPPSPEDFLTDDLVTAKFFEFQPLISVVDKITEIVNRSYQSSDAEQLITALYAEAGIQKKFGTFIITSVCGDLILIPKFVEIFLKTGENPPQNIHGIWTPRDDQYLKSEIPERLDYLKRLHGAKRIELRKTFITNDIVWI